MTVTRVIARIAMTKQQQEAYNPPPGIDVIWLEVNPTNCVAEFCVSDSRVDNRLRWDEEKLKKYLKDNLHPHQFLGDHYLSPRKAIREEVDFDHPFLDDPVSAEIKKHNIRNVRPYRITDMQLRSLNRMLDDEWGLRPAKPIKRLTTEEAERQPEADRLIEEKHNKFIGLPSATPNVNVMQIAEIENEDTLEDAQQIVEGFTSGSAPRTARAEEMEAEKKKKDAEKARKELGLD